MSTKFIDSPECPDSLREAALTHAFLMGLGYSAKDHIFMEIDQENDRVCVLLHPPAGVKVAFRVGKCEFPEAVMVEKWLRLLKEWSPSAGIITMEDINRLTAVSRTQEMIPEMISQLRAAGHTQGLPELN